MRWSTSVLVGAFVVADVVVLGGAYVVEHRGPGPATTGGAVQAASSSAAPASAGSGSTGPTDWTGPLTLAASGSGRLARVTRGSCDPRDPVRSRVWLARSYLAPLRETTVPGLQESLGVRVDDDRVSIVGVGPMCKTFGFVTTDGGRTWRRGAVPDDIWYLDSDTTSQVVHGPASGGKRALTCTPVSVATVSDGEALVSCGADGIHRLVPGRADAAAPEMTYAVQGAVGAAQAGGRPDDALALTATGGCAAALVRLNAGGSLQQLSCLGQDSAPLGLATSGTRVLAQVGYQLRYSRDGGRSFADYPGDVEPTP